MTPHQLTLIRLQTTPGIGQRTLRRILDWADDSDAPLDSIFGMSADDLKRRFKLKDDAIAALGTSDIEAAEALAAELYRQGVRLLTRQDDAYPVRLQHTLGDKAPPLLYMRGDPARIAAAGVAFSGSRRVSQNGIAHTAQLVEDAVQRGYSVISGHAPGVDIAAHRAALEHGGITLLVLPEGVLKFRLRAELRDLYDQSPDNVLVVSEFPPEMSWAAGHAMARNRTIIGLARALCVIEAGDSGGTLHAGQTALQLGVPVWTLDYPDPPPSAAGNALLLADGACPLPVTPRPTLPESLECGGAADTPEQLPLF